MADTLEYWTQWKDKVGNTHRVELYLDSGPVNNTEIEYQQEIPWVKKTRGTREIQYKNPIRGSEYQFNFMIPSADISDFDAILESNYKDWKIVKKYDGNIEWTGWILPENAHRPFIKRHDYFEMSLTATDGLAKLKDIKYKNFSTGAKYSDRVSFITTIKRALEHLELALDFRVQLNTYETTLMTSTECAMDKCTVNNNRYVKVEDGREFNEDCYTIIETVLKDFNCYLKQEGGYYWIVNPQEVDSYYYPIPWSTLTVGTRTANDLEVSLSGYKYSVNTDLQKIRPLEEYQYRFNDRNLGENLLSNGDFSSGTTGWNKSGYFGSLTASSGYGEIPAIYSLDTPPTYVYTDDESITQYNSDDQLEVSFKARITSFTGTAGTEPLMKVEVYRGTTFVPVKSNNVFPMYESANFTTYTVRFALPATASNYHVRIYTYARSTGAFTSFNFEWDDVYFVPKYADGEDITYDRYYTAINNDSIFFDIIDDQVLNIGDSLQDNDLGAIMVGGVRTEAWNRYGKSDGESIQVLYGQNILENFSRYKDYVRCEIIDPNHNISSISVLNIEGRLYEIANESVVYEKGIDKVIKCELIELLNSAVTSSISWQFLTSVDGTSGTSNEVVAQPNPSAQDLQDVTDEGATTTNSIQITSGSLTASGYVRADSGLRVGSSKWTLKLGASNELVFEYNSTDLAMIDTSGKIYSVNDAEVYDTDDI